MKKLIVVVVLLLVAFGLYWGYGYYQKVFEPNTRLDKNFELRVPEGSSFQSVLDTLSRRQVLDNVESFKWVAEKKGYPQRIRAGRYLIKPGWNNNEIVNKLRSGAQDPVKLVLHDISGVYELAGKLGKKLEPDSVEFLELLTSAEKLKTYEVNPQTATAYFLPNTYEVYWTLSPEAFMSRMRDEFYRFWTDERLRKAREMNLTPVEVVTLASIVEKETVKPDEKKEVAGLYYNRIRKGMKLQSDPTVIYAINMDHPTRTIQRVYYKDLAYSSPYNTYQNPGLPPGPIKIPALSSIDAVLNYAHHDYIFMVADPERPGYHSFATTLRGHEINRRKCINWLNEDAL